VDQLFITINAWIVSGTAWAALGCFLWGIVSVLFSPCHLASIPLIIGYVGGQNQIIEGRKATGYAVLFTLGLFITIAVIGVVCVMLGRLMGDIGSWWAIIIGVILIWVALDMLGIAKCSMPGSLMGRFKLQGLVGAFVLGLAYGILSGSCTFGFIAPILAIITVQKKIMTGVTLITLFAIGHCLPIALAGSSTTLVRKLLESSRWQKSGSLFRRLAGVLIGVLGVYFFIQPFL